MPNDNQEESWRLQYRRVVLPDPEANLIIRLSDNWSPTKDSFSSSIKRFTWADQDFTRAASRLAIKDGQLEITFDGTHIDLHDAFQNTSLQKRSSTGELENDLVFRARLTLMTGASPSIDTEYGFRYSMKAKAFDWNIVPETKAVRAWVAFIEGEADLFPGNLEIWSGENGSAMNFRFSGAYTYSLLYKQAPWILVVDTGSSAPPDGVVLMNDLLALQFVLGRQIRASPLYGVDDSAEVVAYAGRLLGDERPAHVSAYPTPPYWQDMTVFFSAISDAFRGQPKYNLRIPLLSYLEALTNNVDAAYLRIHVGLEAFAYSLLNAAGQLDTMLVEDEKKWKKWVKSQKNSIADHAKGRDPKLAESLYDNVRLACARASGKVVRDGFRLYEIELDNKMEEELKKRNLAVHRYQMTDDYCDVERELRRIELVRALLVALIAKAVGYSGPLAWTEAPYGGRYWSRYRLPEDWWPKSGKLDKALPYFVAGKDPRTQISIGAP